MSRSGAQPSPRQVIGPTLTALYILDYAPSVDEAVLAQLVDYLEAHHFDWNHPIAPDGLTERFAPGVRDDFPRQTGGYFQTPLGTPGSARVALVYLKMYARTGSAEYLEKAEALVASVLRRQQLEDGHLHHVGLNTWSADHAERLVLGPNGAPTSFINPRGMVDQHPWSGLKANVLRTLLDYADLRETLGIDCGLLQNIDLAQEVLHVAPESGPLALEATASSGLPVVFSLVSGPASLSGATLTLDGTPGIVRLIVSQPGDEVYCAAASRNLYVSVGDNAPPAPDSLDLEILNESEIRLDWTYPEFDGLLLGIRVEYREAAADSWTVDALLATDARSHIVSGLTGGVEYEFRVFAYNPVSDSPSSPVATGSPLAEVIQFFLEAECGDYDPAFWAPYADGPGNI